MFRERGDHRFPVDIVTYAAFVVRAAELDLEYQSVEGYSTEGTAYWVLTSDEPARVEALLEDLRTQDHGPTDAEWDARVAEHIAKKRRNDKRVLALLLLLIVVAVLIVIFGLD